MSNGFITKILGIQKGETTETAIQANNNNNDPTKLREKEFNAMVAYYANPSGFVPSVTLSNGQPNSVMDA